MAGFRGDRKAQYSMLAPEFRERYTLDQYFGEEKSLEKPEPKLEGIVVADLEEICSSHVVVVNNSLKINCSILIRMLIDDSEGGREEGKLLEIWVYDEGDWYWVYTDYNEWDNCPP